MRVLLAEDELPIAFMIEDALQEAGHQVVIMADSAEDALRKLEGVAIDFALIDIHLRDGTKAGLKLARILDVEFGVPSLFVSAQPEKSYATEHRALGCLAKPFTPSDIQKAAKTVEMLVAGHCPPPEMLPEKLELFSPHD